jgi:uncharacterized protein
VRQWKSYGRQAEVSELREILSRERWTFIKIEARKRIGKTSLIQHSLPERFLGKTFYLQIPDSSPTGVVSRFQKALHTYDVQDLEVSSLQQVAQAIETLIVQGWAVILDEFQYFVRKSLFEFNSFLQESVDRIEARTETITGSLIVLGSLHTKIIRFMSCKRKSFELKDFELV